MKGLKMSNKIGICKKCGEEKRLTRGYCSNKCYSYLLRNNLINRLEKIKSPNEINHEQEEILIGSLLGDGGIYPTTGQAYFTVTRNLKDLDYLKCEYEYFKDFCNSPIKISKSFDKRTNKYYLKCKFATRGSLIFTKYHNEWYPKGKKIIPDSLYLTPLICAIWFCDDGCVTIHKTTNRLRLKLSTHCFNKRENEKLIKILKEKINVNFSISKDKNNYYIVASDAATKKFIKYIEKHIPNSMKRKITWDEHHFKQKNVLPHLKNRNKFEFSEREVQILNSIYNEKQTPRSISKKINWTRDNATPSGLFLYLNRFFKNKLVEKSGCNKKTYYKLTELGKSALSII